MQNVEQLMIVHRVHVYHHILEHHQIADLNVLLTLIAHPVKLVSMKSAEIHAMEHVDLELNVQSEIMFQLAVASLDSLEILSLNVLELLNLHHLKMTIHATHHHVEQMQDVITEFVHVTQNIEEIHIQDVDQNVF